MDYFSRKRSWHEFYSHFNFLPQSSKTKAKISADPEFAKRMVSSLPESYFEVDEKEAQKQQREEGPSLEGYNLEIEKLNQVIDAINMLRIQVASLTAKKGKKPPKMEPVQRPMTEFQKLVERKRKQIGLDEAKGISRKLGFDPAKFGFS